MPVGQTNALVLNEKLSVSIGDWLRVVTTTNIGTADKIAATGLNEYDNARDDHFQDWHVYIEDFANNGVERKVQKYYAANTTLNIYGANLLEDAPATNLATIRLGRYSFGQKQRAINTAIKEIYPTLHKWVVDKSLATNEDLVEYPMPSSFDGGDVHSVAVNMVIANASTSWQQMYRYDSAWSIVNEGNTLRLSSFPGSGNEIKIEGVVPLGTVGAASSVVNIGEPQASLLAAYAKYKLYQGQGQPVSSEDRVRYKQEMAEAYSEYKRLLSGARMTMPARPLPIH